LRRWAPFLDVLLLVGIGMFSLTQMQRAILFPRQYTTPDPRAGADVPGLEKIWIPSAAGPVEGWLLAGQGVDPNHPGPLVLFAHGNAELIEYWPGPLSEYRRMGVSVFLPEFRGYGRSAGSPSQQAITEDFLAFYDQIARRPEVDPKRIVFHGRSMGGGAVCALAALRPPRALILQSTFASIKDLARKFMLPGFLVADPFDNQAVLRQLAAPILILHGRQDDLIPFDHAERLHAAAPGSQFIAYDCGHNDCPPDEGVYWNDIRGFLREAGVIEQGR
jgi:fermentation-respiration switch protein FrsA (DUF1100 family)